MPTGRDFDGSSISIPLVYHVVQCVSMSLCIGASFDFIQTKGMGLFFFSIPKFVKEKGILRSFEGLIFFSFKKRQ